MHDPQLDGSALSTFSTMCKIYMTNDLTLTGEEANGVPAAASGKKLEQWYRPEHRSETEVLSAMR